MTRLLWVSLITVLSMFMIPNPSYGLEEQKNDSAGSTAGPAKAALCVPCHAADGNSLIPNWPKIAGQPLRYLKEQLLEYRRGEQGKRFEPTMYGISQGLSDQDIDDLAVYFASQKTSPGATKAALLALGEKIYRGGNPKTGVPACIACHGASGEGNLPAGFPKLSGQHPEYTLDQLRKFKSGTRANDPNGIMRDISKRMTEEEWQAVSSYVSGLH